MDEHMRVDSKNAVAEAIALMASKVPGGMKKEGDYIGEDGLLYCGSCHTAKQCFVEFFGQMQAMPIMCDCEKKREQEQEAQYKAAERQALLARLKRDCFPTAEPENWTFADDDRRDARISDAMQRYAGRWDEMKKQNMGLLLYGGVGTGKTFYAACIANQVMLAGVRAKMTSFSRIVNTMQSLSVDRQDYLDHLVHYPLLILDDLGAERSSDYMLEQVYSIIDARYQARLPLIVTTNLPIETIKEPADLKYKRIYDRIIEMCFPVRLEGSSRRRNAVRENYAARAKLLGLDG